MVRNNTESFLGANLPKDFVSDFWEKAIPSKSKANKAEIVAAMANAWLELADDAKKHYLYPSENDFDFKQYIESIVENKMTELAIERKPKEQLTVKQKIRETMKFIGEMAVVETQQPGTIYQVLTHQERHDLEEFCKTMLGDQSKKSRKKA